MRSFVLTVALLAACAAVASAQFYSSMSMDERAKLAEDYYLAGSQYLQAGIRDKGREFQELAFIMYPRLDPKSIRDLEQPQISELLARTTVSVAGPPEADAAPALVRSRLLRFAGSMLMQDTEAVLNCLDGSVYLTDMGREFTQAEAARAIEGLFATVSLRGIQPSRLYDLQSLRVEPASPELVARGWSGTYTAEIAAGMDLSRNLSIWTSRQRFYFRNSGGRWLIAAYGQALPPAGWRPKAPAGTASIARAPAVSPAEERAAIEAAFLNCIARFMQKDADGAIMYFGPRVRLERLGATVSREELRNAFQSYFGSLDFGGLKTEDLVEPQSVFVVETERFPDLASGNRYLLTVQTRLDLAEKIPFWTKFQEYYFTAVEGSWRIFAIF
jgi:hypothetical protein